MPHPLARDGINFWGPKSRNREMPGALRTANLRRAAVDFEALLL